MTWLYRPYPFIQGVRQKLLISFAFGVFIFLFLGFFQPFGLVDLAVNKSLVILGFATITSVSMAIHYTIFPLLFPKLFDSESWNIGKNIVFVLWNILIIAVLNYIYNYFQLGGPLHLQGLLVFLSITLSVGIFPVTLLIFINELYLTGRNSRTAAEISAQLNSVQAGIQPDLDQDIRITGELKQDTLELHLSELIYIKAVDNYCEVHFLRNGEIRKQLLRVSLKDLEGQFESVSQLVRCHRSYMVNKERILQINGNARAYSLQLEATPDQIPLSRGFNKDILFS